MTIYILVLFTLFLLTLYSLDIKSQSKNPILLFYSLLILFLLDTFRWETGTDWEPYLNIFQNSLYEIPYNVEPGYGLLNKLIRTITPNYTVYLFIHALFFYSVLYFILKKYSLNPTISVLVFYFSFITVQGMNRQFIAMGLCLLAIPYILDKKFKKFILLIIAACFFHVSALVFTAAYFLNFKLTKKIVFFTLGLTFLISVTQLANRLDVLYPFLGPFIENKLSGYAEGTVSNPILNVIIGIIKRLFWLFPCIYVSSKIKNNKIFYLSINMYLFSTCLYIVFNNSLFQIFIGRLTSYFEIMLIFIIPFIFSLFKNRSSSIIFLIFICLYGYIMMEKGFDSYVIQGSGDVFRPYKSVIFGALG